MSNIATKLHQFPNSSFWDFVRTDRPPKQCLLTACVGSDRGRWLSQRALIHIDGASDRPINSQWLVRTSVHLSYSSASITCCIPWDWVTNVNLTIAAVFLLVPAYPSCPGMQCRRLDAPLLLLSKTKTYVHKDIRLTLTNLVEHCAGESQRLTMFLIAYARICISVLIQVW